MEVIVGLFKVEGNEALWKEVLVDDKLHDFIGLVHHGALGAHKQRKSQPQGGFLKGEPQKAVNELQDGIESLELLGEFESFLADVQKNEVFFIDFLPPNVPELFVQLLGHFVFEEQDIFLFEVELKALVQVLVEVLYCLIARILGKHLVVDLLTLHTGQKVSNLRDLEIQEGPEVLGVLPQSLLF